MRCTVEQAHSMEPRRGGAGRSPLASSPKAGSSKSPRVPVLQGCLESGALACTTRAHDDEPLSLHTSKGEERYMSVQEPCVAPKGDAHEQMMDLLLGFWISQALRAVADLSLADHLAGGGLTAAEVAQREASAPHSTLRLMRAAVAIGLLSADDQGRFYGTPLLATLRKDAPRSLRPLVMAFTNHSQWRPWGEFVSAVRGGRTQMGTTLGTGFFTYLEHHPELASEFSAAMGSITSLWGLDVAKVIDTTKVRCAVDVGGASGSLLRELQAANPALQGVIFDRPNVAAGVARGGITKHTKVVGGDFFVSVPRGDLYLLKFVLHNWDDASAVTILRRCREAMVRGGRIAIIEMIVGELDKPGRHATLMDLNMLAVLSGRERSLPEFDALLEAAGLCRTAVRHTAGPQSVIEAVAASDGAQGSPQKSRARERTRLAAHAAEQSTYVLIHGSWHDGSVWADVIKRLEHHGHTAFGPTVAGHGKGVSKQVTHAQAAQSVVDFIMARDLRDIVLVGHSAGGTVISKVVEVIPDRVRRLVYVNAFVLKDGESMEQAVPQHYRQLFKKLAAQSSDNTVVLPIEIWQQAFINDADLDFARLAYQQLSPEPYQLIVEPLDLKKFYTLNTPRSFILATDDISLPAGEWGWHPRMTSRLGEHRFLQVPGSHELLLTNPNGLADKIIEAGDG
jgi:pimeloyl-ACP methyl ester carboxylesterase